MPLEQVVRQSTADAVFDQLVDQILSGAFPAGTTLPAERQLTAELGVSRPAVREALQRLAQTGLIDIRQGESTRVRAVSDATSLDLLPRLLRVQEGVDVVVVRSIIEMRATIGEDAARRCADRATAEQVRELRTVADRMAATEPDDVHRLQELDVEFWRVVVVGSGNIAYQLAFNGLVAAYQPISGALARFVAREVGDVGGHRRLVAALESHRPEAAARAAQRLLAADADGWKSLLRMLKRGAS